MAAKLDIKAVLSAIDRCDKNFYSNLSPDEQKAFVAWTTMRFASSANGDYMEHYLIMVNDIVNHNFSSLSKHPELQWKLLALCGVGRNQFHPWIKPGRKKGKNDTQEILSQFYPNAKQDELELLEQITTKDELKQMLADAGHDDKDIKKIVGK